MTAWRALSRGVFAAAIDWLAVGMLFALTPWLVYWVLIGNVPSTAAASVALTVGVAGRGFCG